MFVFIFVFNVYYTTIDTGIVKGVCFGGGNLLRKRKSGRGLRAGLEGRKVAFEGLVRADFGHCLGVGLKFQLVAGDAISHPNGESEGKDRGSADVNLELARDTGKPAKRTGGLLPCG